MARNPHGRRRMIGFPIGDCWAGSRWSYAKVPGCNPLADTEISPLARGPKKEHFPTAASRRGRRILVRNMHGFCSLGRASRPSHGREWRAGRDDEFVEKTDVVAARCRGSVLWDGRPLFGASKTIRGVLSSLLLTALASRLDGVRLRLWRNHGGCVNGRGSFFQLRQATPEFWRQAAWRSVSTRFQNPSLRSSPSVYWRR